MPRAEIAEEYFRKGYNCAQSVAMAFADLTGLSEKESARMASSFGGGLGRMREVCGAVSGMALVAGILYGYDDPGVLGASAKHYALVQELAGKFRDANGSVVCRELLGDRTKVTATPEPRTAEYYKKRPCAELVRMAASILEEYVETHGDRNEAL